jgi:hypothetical protein
MLYCIAHVEPRNDITPTGGCASAEAQHQHAQHAPAHSRTTLYSTHDDVAACAADGVAVLRCVELLRIGSFAVVGGLRTMSHLDERAWTLRQPYEVGVSICRGSEKVCISVAVFAMLEAAISI